MKVSLLKYIDKFLGRSILTLLKAPQVCAVHQPTYILIIRPGGIGDAVLLAPSIISIKNSYPDIHITVLAERRNFAVFSMISSVEKVLCYDRPSELFLALQGRYDVVIDSEQWYRLSAVVARVIRAPVKIGFGTNERQRMFTHVIAYDGSVYESSNFESLIKPLGIENKSIKGDLTESLVLPSLEENNAANVLTGLVCRKFVVIFPGASIKEKRWGVDNFRRVAEELSAAGYGVVVVGGRSERAAGDYICKGLGENLAGQTTLQETAAIVAKASLLISGDSGILHIAALLGISTISLFGPSSVEKWAPKGEQHIVLAKRLSCSPCSRYGTIPTCPHNVRCMTEITPEEVISAAKHLLKKN